MRIIYTRYFNLFIFLLVFSVDLFGLFLPVGIQLQSNAPVYNTSPFIHLTWCLVFLLTLIFLVFQLITFTLNFKYINYGITPIFTLTYLGAIGWVFSDAYVSTTNYWVTLLFYYLVLVCTAIMYVLTQHFYNQQSRPEIWFKFKHYILGRAWLSIQLPWVLFLTVKDTCNWLIHEPSTWQINTAAIALAAINTLFATLALVMYRDVLFGATTLWIFIWVSIGAGTWNSASNPQWPILLSSSICGAFIAIVTVSTMMMIIIDNFLKESTIAESNQNSIEEPDLTGFVNQAFEDTKLGWQN